MDLYISSLVLGAAGLGAMALGGLGFRGHAGGSGNQSAGHGGSAAGGHGAGPQIHPGAHGAGHGHGHSVPMVPGGHAPAHGLGQSARDAATNAAWSIASPRVLFSVALGFGATGELTRQFLSGPLHVAVAVLGGVVLERFLVTPLWNLAMRFASNPAQMLESAVTDEATAVTSFDTNGQGIVSVEVDGQIVQILATLRRDDRVLGGPRVRAGQRVRIDDVDAAKNCCTVSLI